jgi:hypothetical protein
MRPGPDAVQRSQIRDHEIVGPEAERPQAQTLVSLNEEQGRLLAVLRAQQDGMTVRQLQARLPWPEGGVQSLLETLLERQLIARLNTIVPSYVYRYGGPDTGVW